MIYNEMVARIGKETGISPEVIKNVIFAMPFALSELGNGEIVRTPLGVFRMTARAAWSIKPPTKRRKVDVPAKMVVKLKPGWRLRKQPG